MNGAEYAALDDISLPPLAYKLYVHCFRRAMNYSDGTVYYSYPKMCEVLAYEPKAKSKDKAYRATKAKVVHLIKRLIEAGLIQLLQKGDINTGQCAKWYCCLADNDAKKRNNSQVCLNQEHRVNIHQEQTVQNEAGQGLQPQQHRENIQQEQHISDLPYNKYIRAREFGFCEQVRLAARNRQLADNESLPGVFQQFLDSPKYRDKFQSHDEWIKDWGYWCSTSKVYAQQWSSTHAKQDSNDSAGGQSVMEQLKQDAERWK